MAKELIGVENFIEVYVSTPIEVCEQRDTKGLYKKARSGSLSNFPGISSPYEAPSCPHISLDLGSMLLKQSAEALVKIIIRYSN
jgi:adenylylsulfate kinase-like enzyme